MIAPRTKYGGIAQPPLCIIEEKRDDFAAGWAQALAELVASSMAGANHWYGVVTTGKLWEFGRLEQGVFTIDPVSISAADSLEKILDTLNWLFGYATISKLSKMALKTKTPIKIWTL